MSLGGDGDRNFDATYQLVDILKPLEHFLFDIRIEGDRFFAGPTIGGHKILLGVCFINQILVHRDLQVFDVILSLDRHLLRWFVVVVAVMADSG